MKKPYKLLAATLLAASLTAQAQTIHYVDADLTNTTIGGAAPDIGINLTSPDRPFDDNLWGYDDDSNWANPTPTGGAIWAGGTSDTGLPDLATTITGLTPNAAYAIYAFGWTDSSNNWDMSAGLVAGALTQFRNGPAGDYYLLGNGAAAASPDPDTITSATIDGVLKTFAAPLETSEGNRDVYLVQLGNTQASASGEITVYVNTYAGGDRTWYDGVGYEEVSELPSVGILPASADVVLGDDAVFSANVDSPLPITSYQWKQGGSNIPGATTDTLTIPAVDLDENGASFTVTVTNSAGSATSDPAILTVGIPDVTPDIQLVLQTLDAEFSIAMPATQTYSYQWQKDDVDIPGATSETLVVPAVTSADAGLYRVMVTLADGPMTSTTGELVVPPAATMSYVETVLADSPIAYWRLGEAVDSIEALDETTPQENFDVGPTSLLGQPGVILGDPNTALSVDGIDTSVLEGQGGFDDDDLNPAVFSIEFWARPTGGTGRRTVFSSSDTNGTPSIDGYELGLNAASQWEFRTGQGVGNAWNTLTGPAANFNEWNHLVATYDGAEMKLYLNGLPAGSLAADTFTPQTAWPSRIGGGANELLPAIDIFTGEIDEVSFYGNALSALDAQAHYVASFDPDALPVFNTQPASQAVLIGGSAVLSASALSGSGVSYQWRRAGIDLVGETGTTLSFPAVELADAGSYDVVATNGSGSTTSDPADLVPLTDYVGTIALPDETNTVLNLTGTVPWFGGNVAASDADGLWRQRTVFGILPGQTPYGYQTTAATAGASLGETEVKTTISGLTPNTAYAVWTLLSNKPGFSTGLLAGFDGDPIQAIGIADMIDTGLISVSSADPWNILHGYLGVRTSNGSGEIAVNVDYRPGSGRTVYNGLGYQLAVPSAEPPVVTIDPIDQTIPVGTDATFTVDVSSASAVTYQWQKDSVDLPGETTDTLVVTGVDGGDAAQYRAVITNGQGSVNSAAAYLVPVADFVGTFVFPTSANTILTRDSSSIFSGADATIAEADGLWYEDPNLSVPGESVSTYGFRTVTNTELAGDAEIQTTISGLDPTKTYAVWVLYAFATGDTGDRLTASLAGEAPKSFDDSTLDTGLVTGAANGLTIYHGLLGVTAPNGSGEIDAVSDYQGLNRTMVLGYGYQTSTLPQDLSLAIDEVNGDITLTWAQGTLQASTDLGMTDPWTSVPGATSPYVWPGTESTVFFRVVE